MVAQPTVSAYMLQLYIPTHAVRQPRPPVAQSFTMVMLGGGLQFLPSSVIGTLSDCIGHVRIMLTTSAPVILLIYPIFTLLRAYPIIGVLLVLQIMPGIFKTAYSGPMPALMSKTFPTRVRSTGLPLGYSLGVTLSGGFVLSIITWLTHITGDTLAPSYCVLTTAAVGTISLTTIALRHCRQVHTGRVLTLSLRSVTPLFHVFYE